MQHAGRAANHNHALDIGLGYAGIFQSLFDGFDGFLYQILGQVVKLLAGNDGMNFMAV